MMNTKRLVRLGTAMGLSLALAGCSCDGESGPDGGSEPNDGATSMDGALAADGAAPVDGDVAAADGASPGADAGVPACVPAPCGGRVYACGNCMDDDADGRQDATDDGCVGPCDDSEDVYDLEIPGGDSATCRRDCYYDADQGSGNDGCEYDERCDPLVPDLACPFTPPGGSVRCPDTQPADCLDNCRPLVPNGCDCFGCCELPAGSGSFVFLGSVDADGNHTCTPDAVGDPTRCRACTPYAGCINTCGPCELCLGRTTLPPECLPPPPADAGPPVDGGGADGGPVDGGPVDAGTPPPPRCDTGAQSCGLPTDPACPATYYCLTGCCIYLG